MGFRGTDQFKHQVKIGTGAVSKLLAIHDFEQFERQGIVDQGKIIAMDTVQNLIAILGGGVIQIGIDAADKQLLSDLSALPAVKRATITPQVSAASPAESQEGEEVEETEEVAPPPSAGPVIVKIESKNSRDALVNVITYLNEHDVTLHSMEILESNLENVFLHLTGKKLRE